MTANNKSEPKRVPELSTTELRELIGAVVHAELDTHFKRVVCTMESEFQEQLEEFRTLMITVSPKCHEKWASVWADIAAHLETSIAEGLRAANAPASASDIANALAKHSDHQLNRMLWQSWPAEDLAAIRAAVRKRLGLSDAPAQADLPSAEDTR